VEDEEINLGSPLIRRGRIYGGVPRCERGSLPQRPTRRPWDWTYSHFRSFSFDRFRRQPGRSRAHAKPVFHPRSKHIAIQYHFTRELVQTVQLVVKYIPTKVLVADSLTKSLPRPEHVALTEIMGVYERHQKGKRSDLTMREVLGTDCALPGRAASVRHGAIGTPSSSLGNLEGSAVICVVCISTRCTGIQRLSGLCTIEREHP